MFNINAMVPGNRLLTVIRYKYTILKVISFIVTEYAGIKKAGIICLSKYP